jgi:hypothetical protein
MPYINQDLITDATPICNRCKHYNYCAGITECKYPYETVTEIDGVTGQKRTGYVINDKLTLFPILSYYGPSCERINENLDCPNYKPKPPKVGFLQLMKCFWIGLRNG